MTIHIEHKEKTFRRHVHEFLDSHPKVGRYQSLLTRRRWFRPTMFNPTIGYFDVFNNDIEIYCKPKYESLLKRLMVDLDKQWPKSTITLIIDEDCIIG